VKIRPAHQEEHHIEGLSILNPFVPDTFAILRLYLEKYEILAEEDRRVHRRIVTVLVNPPLVMDVGNEATDDDRKAAAALIAAYEYKCQCEEELHGLKDLYPPNAASIDDKETDDDRKAEAAQTVDSQPSVDYEAQVKIVYSGAKLLTYDYGPVRVEAPRGDTHVVLGDMISTGTTEQRRVAAWKSAEERLAVGKVAK
jgi:hypothetical protein